ncbi:hypothetical protein QM012_007370 [Aureobasidium pullulans]|uniref:Apple domain-containing protein n=1 Tax=Aureobasidium pullulans TaxID=5580 RepID=A0ABR0TMS1_AURPU
MKNIIESLCFLSAASLTLANPLLQHRAVCNADNCARAVTGTARASPPLASRLADCSSFQKVTITPAAVTSTITITPSTSVITDTIVASSTIVISTTTPTTIFVGDMKKRQMTDSPNVVPLYASACSGSSRYASACSCFGATKTTITVAAPTVLITVTAMTPLTTTSTTTTSIVATSTSVIAVTSTVVPGPKPICGSTIQGAGPCGCTYTVTCGQKYTGGRIIETLNLLSETDCVNACDGYDNCFNVDYSRSTGQCNIYQRASGPMAVDDDDAYSFAGTCPFHNSNAQCVVG